jgi:copper chaperone CopZ
MMKKQSRIIGTGIITAIAASLCCITPVLALLAGTSGMAAAFLWLEPFRPYLIGITILTIGFAWYQKLRPVKKDDCNCDATTKSKFIHKKAFLGLETVFAILMMAFPFYSKIFYPTTVKNVLISAKSVPQMLDVKIEGMTCAACEEHVKLEVNKLAGIISSKISYTNQNAIITFDSLKTTRNQIEKAINKTGYLVIE